VSFVHGHALASTVQPPCASLQLSTVQAMPSLHTTAVPPQTPEVHLSPVVQKKPSLHRVPFGFVGYAQLPVEGLHVPLPWHWSEAVQTTGLPPVHAPLWHVSDWVHAFLSSHAVPSPLAGFEHCPFDASQVPAVWH
jgi:hypothetical protein